MYKVIRDSDLTSITAPFDIIVKEIIEFIDLNSKIKRDGTEKDIDLLLSELEKVNPRLGNVARVSDLKKHIYKLKVNKIKIKDQYEDYVANYLDIIEGRSLKSYVYNTLIKDAFKYFYKSIIHSKTFIENYYSDPSTINKLHILRKNSSFKKTCPYCDFYELEFNITSVDHFLPISNYPVLGIFPDNLIVACTACNDRIKGNKMNFPIFHPYFHNVADYIEFYLDYTSSPVSIKYKSIDSGVEKNLENFLNLFEIPKRVNEKTDYFRKERAKVRKQVKNRLKEISNFREIMDTDIKRIMLEEYKENLSEQREGSSEYRMSKIKADLVKNILETQLDKEVAYIKYELLSNKKN